MTIFDSVRQLLIQGDTAQALRLLIGHLEKENNNPEALRTLRVIEASFNTTREKERRGTLDAAEVRQANNITNDSLLSITDDLDAGRRPALVMNGGSSGMTRIYWFIGGGILLLLGIVAGILLRGNNAPATIAETKETMECPVFNKGGLSVMLIPFQDLGDAKSKPELALLTRIRDLTTENGMKSDVQIFPGNRFEKATPAMEEARAIGEQCSAKMVIWGQYEKVEGGISLDVRYTFTGKANLPGGVITQTFQNLSELRSGSEKFDNNEDAIFTLCTAIALHEGRMDLAEKWLDKVKDPSLHWQRIREMLKKG